MPLFPQGFSPSERWRALAPEWKFLGLLCLGLAFLLVPRAPFNLDDPALPDSVYVLRPGGDGATTPTLVYQGEWTPHTGGMVAATPGASVSFETEAGPWRGARLKLGGTSEPVWGVTLSRDHTRQTIFNLTPGEEYPVGAEQFPGNPLFGEPLKVSIFLREGATQPALLNRVALTVTAYPPGEIEPGIPGALFGSLMPLALACFLFLAGRRTLRQAAIMAGIAAGAALFAAATRPELIRYFHVGTMSFFLGAACGAYYKSVSVRTEENLRPGLRRAAEACGLCAVVGFALWARLDALVREWSLPLLPDARGYLQIALGGTFYQTAQDHAPYIREPLFPALLRWAFVVLPDSASAGRLVTACLGTVATMAIWLVGRRIFNPMTGLLAAAMYAMNPWLAEQSASLLRDDTVVALFLLLLAVPLYLEKHTRWRAVAFGVCGAALALTRLNGLFLLVPLLAIAAWRGRWRPGEIAATLAIAILPVVPHLVYNARVGDGDPLYSANVHTRFYLNWDMMGQPGFPADRAAWEANPYAGDVASMGEYASALGPVTVVKRLVAGYVRLLAYPFPHEHLFFGREWLMLFGLAGAWVVYTRLRDTWWVWVWFGLFLFPLALIAGSRFDPRLALPAVPAVLLVWSAGVVWVAELIKERVSAGNGKAALGA